jgi:hypothetical protein
LPIISSMNSKCSNTNLCINRLSLSNMKIHIFQ